MATGAYDANGIWKYGEDDNIALFSDTLNKLADSTSSALTSDRGRIATLEASSLSGLIPIKPSSVTVAGGTASVSNLGQVTFNAATSLTLNNVFKSIYSHYRVIISWESTGVTNSQIQLCSGGVASTASYVGPGLQSYSGGVSQFSNNGAAWFPSGLNSPGMGPGNIVMDIFNPFVADMTTMVSNSFGGDGTVGPRMYTVHGSHNVYTAYDGLKFFPSGGTTKGTIQILGYNK